MFKIKEKKKLIKIKLKIEIRRRSEKKIMFKKVKYVFRNSIRSIQLEHFFFLLILIYDNKFKCLPLLFPLFILYSSAVNTFLQAQRAQTLFLKDFRAAL